jgi:hypothetical protein
MLGAGASSMDGSGDGAVGAAVSGDPQVPQNP